jgi:hypothetical protein
MNSGRQFPVKDTEIESEQDGMDLNEKSLPPLLSLPQELHYQIPNQASEPEATKIMAALAKTCHHFAFFRDELKNREAAQLARYIQDANIAKAKAMVIANPKLLLRPVDKVIRVIDENTHQIITNATPLQLALTEDNRDEMVPMLMPYFEQACESENDEESKKKEIEIRKQVKEESAEEKGKNEEITIINSLNMLISAIDNEPFTRNEAAKKWILAEATHKVITAFRQVFAESQPKVIEGGKKRFSLEMLGKLIAICAEAERRWRYDYKKCALLEDGALSFVLRYTATNDAMKFSQGLYYLQEENEKPKQSLELRYGGKNFFDVLRGSSP